jgi:hypothetical protein
MSEGLQSQLQGQGRLRHERRLGIRLPDQAPEHETGEKRGVSTDQKMRHNHLETRRDDRHSQELATTLHDKHLVSIPGERVAVIKLTPGRRAALVIQVENAANITIPAKHPRRDAGRQVPRHDPTLPCWSRAALARARPHRLDQCRSRPRVGIGGMRRVGRQVQSIPLVARAGQRP